MDAELLFYQRIDYEDSAIVEMVLWRVPSPVPPSAHDFKYSLFYGHSEGREIGYDNERGKGDHRHLQDAETPYSLPVSSNWWPISGPTCTVCEAKNDRAENYGWRRF